MLGADLAVLGALGRVGRRFGSAWRAQLGVGLGGVWLWWARWAGCGFGFLCMVYIVHVFFMSSWCLCVYLHVYLKWYHGAWAKQSLALVNETWVLSNSVFEKCDVKRTRWKRKERNGSSGNQHAQLKKDSVDNSPVLQPLIYSFNNTTIRVGKWTASSKCNIEISDCVAEIELTCVSALNKIKKHCCVTQVALAYYCAFLRFCVIVAEINGILQFVNSQAAIRIIQHQQEDY